jgi:hypothetical protein
MIDELERIWEEAVVAQAKHYPIIYLDGLRKNMKNLIQDSWYPSCDLNQACPKFK